jgi:hypothetical protein
MSEKIDWSFITSKIEEERCVLMIGPEVAVVESENPLQTTLKNYLIDPANNTGDLVYYSEDEFFSFENDTQKTLTYFKIRQFYNQFEPPEIYKKIAEIPFHLIISLSPDLLLKEILTTKSINFEFDFYHKKQNPLAVERPTKNKPLLYNLVGSVEDEDSLVFTYNDLFDYLTRILGTHHLPNALREALARTKNFIFLGFKFEKWYLKLLLRLLDLHQGGKYLNAFGKKATVKDYAQSYYSREFNINFVDEDIAQFVNRLHTECQSAGIIRKQGQSGQPTIKDEIKDLIANNLIREALVKLNKFTQSNSPEHVNDIKLLSRRYKDINGDLELGLIERRDAVTPLNVLSKDILDLVDRVY